MSPLLSIFDIFIHFLQLASLACAHANRPQKFYNCIKRFARFHVNEGAAGRRRYGAATDPLTHIIMALASDRPVPQSHASLVG